jgi:hypothetical protein
VHMGLIGTVPVGLVGTVPVGLVGTVPVGLCKITECGAYQLGKKQLLIHKTLYFFNREVASDPADLPSSCTPQL